MTRQEPLPSASPWRRAWVWVRALFSAHLSPESLAEAVAVGVFIGCLPIFGLHLGACILVARWRKLNQPIVYAAANISNPFFAPFLVGAEVGIGETLRYGRVWRDGTLSGTVWEMAQAAPDLLISGLLGSVILGLVLAILAYGSVWAIAHWRAHGPR